MIFQDATIKIISANKEEITIQIGCEGYTFPTGILKDIFTGQHKPIVCLLYNIAVRLALDGVDITDLQAVKTKIESTTFKW